MKASGSADATVEKVTVPLEQWQALTGFVSTWLTNEDGENYEVDYETLAESAQEVYGLLDDNRELFAWVTAPTPTSNDPVT